MLVDRRFAVNFPLISDKRPSATSESLATIDTYRSAVASDQSEFLPCHDLKSFGRFPPKIPGTGAYSNHGPHPQNQTM